MTNPCWALSRIESTVGVIRMTRAKAIRRLSVLLMQSGLVSLIKQESFLGRSNKVDLLKSAMSVGDSGMC